ncbi:hypothetical protein HID58_056329 [Brassica napus]|uniref:Uncharacterized protein n=1 Tax=Brassica napus TaxID=3708 RepID=A0ABQ8AN30_BRANA|nr:hypothetical protein HID58_056329 [Brassica napus]
MAEIDSTSDKSPIAFYFVDISPWPSDSGLRFSLIHFWEARNTASGHCDARFHFIKLFSALPASTQVRIHLQPQEFLRYEAQRDLSSF